MYRTLVGADSLMEDAVVSKDRAAEHIDDDQEPDPFDLELLLETKRIHDSDLESYV